MNALAVSVSIRSVPSKENRSTLARFARWMVKIWGEQKECVVDFGRRLQLAWDPAGSMVAGWTRKHWT